MEAGITLFRSSAQEKLTLAIDALENATSKGVSL
jgi:hypothetical protein